MRLALVHNLPPGGARRVVAELLASSVGHDEIDVFSVDLRSADRFARDGGSTDLRSPTGTTRSYPLPLAKGTSRVGLVLAAEQLPLVYRRISSDIDSDTYDAVIVNHDQFTSAPSILPRLRTPTLYLCHEPRRQSFEYAASHRDVGIRRLVRAPYDSLIRHRDITWARSADGLIANSYFSAESLARAYGRDAIVAHLGVDETMFHPGSEPRSGRVLSVGAVDRLKAHHLVIEALGLLPERRRPGFDVVFERSDPVYAEELVQLAGRRGVDLAMHRGVSDERLSLLYRTAAVTVCAASLEPFGLTTIESICSGTPVVAVREGGFREAVVDGVNGRLVPRAADALAAGIEEILMGCLASSGADLRATILPYWSWDSAVDRLRRAFATVAFT